MPQLSLKHGGSRKGALSSLQGGARHYLRSAWVTVGGGANIGIIVDGERVCTCRGVPSHNLTVTCRPRGPQGPVVGRRASWILAPQRVYRSFKGKPRDARDLEMVLH